MDKLWTTFKKSKKFIMDIEKYKTKFIIFKILIINILKLNLIYTSNKIHRHLMDKTKLHKERQGNFY